MALAEGALAQASEEQTVVVPSLPGVPNKEVKIANQEQLIANAAIVGPELQFSGQVVQWEEGRSITMKFEDGLHPRRARRLEHHLPARPPPRRDAHRPRAPDVRRALPDHGPHDGPTAAEAGDRGHAHAGPGAGAATRAEPRPPARCPRPPRDRRERQ